MDCFHSIQGSFRFLVPEHIEKKTSADKTEAFFYFGKKIELSLLSKSVIIPFSVNIINYWLFQNKECRECSCSVFSRFLWKLRTGNEEQFPVVIKTERRAIYDRF